MNPNRIPFTTGNSASNEQLVDDPGTVRLTVAKKDSATSGPAQAGATLEGAEFKIVSTSSPNWEPITVTTDAKVNAVARGIPLGNIVVTETKAPKGYKLDPEPRRYTISH